MFIDGAGRSLNQASAILAALAAVVVAARCWVIRVTWANVHQVTAVSSCLNDLQNMNRSHRANGWH
jgi:hypothetical protein